MANEEGWLEKSRSSSVISSTDKFLHGIKTHFVIDLFSGSYGPDFA